MPMKTTDAFRKDGLHRCGHCGRVLPVESFYVNSRTQRPDAYCKDCRRETNRCARKKMRPAGSGGRGPLRARPENLSRRAASLSLYHLTSLFHQLCPESRNRGSTISP